MSGLPRRRRRQPRHGSALWISILMSGALGKHSRMTYPVAEYVND